MDTKVKSQKSKVNGFTLLEFLLYFALIAVVMTAVVGFSVDFLRGRSKALVIAAVEQETRFGLMRMLRTIRQATKLNIGASTLNSDNGVLSVDMPSASNTPTIFDLSGGALRMKEGSGAAVPLTTDDVVVEKLRFTKDNLGGNNNAVTAVMTVRFNADGTNTDFKYVITASGTAVIRKD